MAREGLYYTRANSKLRGPDTGGIQFMPVPPPKNPGCLIFGVKMPHARSGGDVLTCDNLCDSQLLTESDKSWAHPMVVDLNWSSNRQNLQLTNCAWSCNNFQSCETIKRNNHMWVYLSLILSQLGCRMTWKKRNPSDTCSPQWLPLMNES